jgi:predicted homoserine dehydrogenase-like protein
MFGLRYELERLESPIRIGIVGIGSIGRGMVLQTDLTPGIICVAIADLQVEKAIAAAEKFGKNYVVVESLEEMHEAIRTGKLAVCGDGNIVAQCEMMDVFVEATSSIVGGGNYGIQALNHNKHLVMMNYEADLMFGSYLMQFAAQKDRVYTVCDGDQPAVLKRMIEEIEFMGFELVLAGNMKGFHDLYANPTTIIPEADKRDLDYKMCASYTDGSKLCVEMAVLANGVNGRTAVPGMFGPHIGDIDEVFQAYDFRAIWDGQHPLVDYVLGCRPGGGVFAIGFTEHPYQQSTLAWLPPSMGPGPFYLFYRPYHLCHFESMATIAEAVVNNRAVLKPEYGFQTNVYAYAKKDLRQGDTLDGMGGYTCYGLIENCCDNASKPGIPICLAEEVTLKREIAKNEKIYLEDVDITANAEGFRLFNLSVAAAAQNDERQM